ARAFERLVGFGEATLRKAQLPEMSVRATDSRDASTLLRKRKCPLRKRLRTIDLEARDVNAGEGVEHVALEVDAPRLASERQGILHHALFRNEVAARPRNRSLDRKRVEAADLVVGLEHLERLRHEPLRPREVGLSQNRRLGECRQRSALDMSRAFGFGGGAD